MKKREENFLQDLESGGRESSYEASVLEDSRQSTTGPRRAAQLSRNDEYRLAKINMLDIGGWVLTLIILWIAYTAISGFFSSETVQEIKPKLSKEQILERKKLRAARVRHERKRDENNQAFSNVESRLADIITEEEVELVEEEEVVEGRRRSEGGFRLGVAIQRLLIKDGTRPENDQ